MIVADKYRTSELSQIPGGYTICVRESNRAEILEYPNVKFPHAYIRKASTNPNVIDAWIKDGK